MNTMVLFYRHMPHSNINIMVLLQKNVTQQHEHPGTATHKSLIDIKAMVLLLIKVTYHTVTHVPSYYLTPMVSLHSHVININIMLRNT